MSHSGSVSPWNRTGDRNDKIKHGIEGVNRRSDSNGEKEKTNENNERSTTQNGKTDTTNTIQEIIQVKEYLAE